MADFILSNSEEGIFCKAKSLISSLIYGLTLCLPPGPPFPCKLPHHNNTNKELPTGLKTLLLLHPSTTPCNGSPQRHHHKTLILHNHMVLPSSSKLPPETSNSSLYSDNRSSGNLDDLIGTESGVYHMRKFAEEEEVYASGWGHVVRRSSDHRQHYCKSGRNSSNNNNNHKFPPPIPLLGRTGNLPGHMPWVLARNYVDGRLVLTEEKLKHHEYFEAHRENGRLILNLVSLEGAITHCSSNFLAKVQGAKEEEEEVHVQEIIGVDEEDVAELDQGINEA